MYEVAQNIREIIEKVLPLLRALPMSRVAEKPQPEKWSKKEIIGHNFIIGKPFASNDLSFSNKNKKIHRTSVR